MKYIIKVIKIRAPEKGKDQIGGIGLIDERRLEDPIFRAEIAEAIASLYALLNYFLSRQISFLLDANDFFCPVSLKLNTNYFKTTDMIFVQSCYARILAV